MNGAKAVVYLILFGLDSPEQKPAKCFPSYWSQKSGLLSSEQNINNKTNVVILVLLLLQESGTLMTFLCALHGWRVASSNGLNSGNNRIQPIGWNRKYRLET